MFSEPASTWLYDTQHRDAHTPQDLVDGSLRVCLSLFDYSIWKLFIMRSRTRSNRIVSTAPSAEVNARSQSCQSVSRQSAWPKIFYPNWISDTLFIWQLFFFWFWNVFFYVASNEVFTRSLVFFTTPNVCNLKLVAGRVATVPSLNAAVGQDGFLSCPCHRKWQKINRLEICDHFGFGRTLPWHLISIIGLQRQGTSLDAGSVEDRRWQAVKLPLNSCRSCWFLCSRVLHWANEQDNINGCVEKV